MNGVSGILCICRSRFEVDLGACLSKRHIPLACNLSCLISAEMLTNSLEVSGSRRTQFKTSVRFSVVRKYSSLCCTALSTYLAVLGE
jgi:hypothetical protein